MTGKMGFQAALAVFKAVEKVAKDNPEIRDKVIGSSVEYLEEQAAKTQTLVDDFIVAEIKEYLGVGGDE